MIVSIDGPAGSGKSTVAQRLATRLAYHYLDTGAMYRTVALAGARAGADLDDDSQMAKIAASISIRFEHEGSSPIPTRVLLDESDVTEDIRTPRCDEAVSRVARLAGVREVMVREQRAIAANNDLVAEGRDIGTVVFPDAAVKIFLTASADERARRRHVEREDRGEHVDAEGVYDAMRTRDAADLTRVNSPLVAAQDAHEVDTTGLSIDEVVERIAAIVADARG